MAKSPWLWWGLAVLIPLGILLCNIWSHTPFYVDDAYISLRYADRFLQGHGLTWNDNEYVEGYSNFLWVLLTIALGFFGMDLVLATKMLGLACTLGTFAALVYYARRFTLPAYATFLGLLVFASSASVAIWSMSGMETPLVLALLAWVAVLLPELLKTFNHRKTLYIALLLGLLCWSRPEGAIYTVCVAAGLLFLSRVPFAARIKMLTLLCGVPFAFFCTQLAFRLGYYHQWTANSALAKLSFSNYHTDSGLIYARDALVSFLPVVAYIVLNLRLTTHARFQGILWLIITVLTTAIIFTGGDIFSSGYRFFVPFVPLLAIMAMHGIQGGMARSIKKEIVILVFIIFFQGWLQLRYYPHRDTGIYGLTQMWEVMGKALKERFGPYQPVVVSPAAGVIPYYSGLPSIDAFGLNDAYLTAHRYDPSMRFGEKMIGHELFDPDYIKMRKPDILMFATPGLPDFCNQIDCHDLLKDYVPEDLHTPNFTTKIWVRKDSVKLGNLMNKQQ